LRSADLWDVSQLKITITALIQSFITKITYCAIQNFQRNNIKQVTVAHNTSKKTLYNTKY